MTAMSELSTFRVTLLVKAANRTEAESWVRDALPAPVKADRVNWRIDHAMSPCPMTEADCARWYTQRAIEMIKQARESRAEGHHRDAAEAIDEASHLRRIARWYRGGRVGSLLVEQEASK